MNDASMQFEAIHDSYRARIQRYLTRLVGETEAEDLTQLVLFKVSEALPRFRGDSGLSTWIYRIATNTALDALRGPACRLSRHSESAAEMQDEDADFEPESLFLAEPRASLEESVIRGEMSQCIREFVERLPENYRTVMVLSELEGFKNGEIAGILGISLDSVKMRLHRAREKLRRDLSTGCSFHRDRDSSFGCDRKVKA